MKKFLIFISLFFLFPSVSYADGKAIKSSQVFSCDGVMYGYHGNPVHYHKVVKKNNTWYPDGEEVKKPSCSIVKETLKEEVTLSDCVDGDTAKFVTTSGVKTTRFLAIDTKETVHPTIKEEPFGKEASNYTCEALKSAKKIVLEYDPNSDKEDKYGRYLAWVFIDDVLLQQKLIEEGLAEVSYLYGDYKYTGLLQDTQTVSKINKVGIWGDSNISTVSLNEEKNNNEQKIIQLIFDKVEKIIDIIFDEIESLIKKIFS